MRNRDAREFGSWQDLILLAGGDTTASLLSNVWFELSDRPNVWNRLQRDVASSLDDGDELPLSKHSKIRGIFGHPVVPGNDRQAEVDPVSRLVAGRMRIL